MKFLFALLFAAIPFCAHAQVTNNYLKGKELAEGHGMPIALVFTGSDWSERSQEVLEVLSSHHLSTEMVIVQVDFPELSRQEKGVLLQNHALKERYKIQHFPTVVLIDTAGNEISRLGFPIENVSDYGAHLKQIGRRYFLLQKRFEKAKEAKEKGELKLCYEEAKKLGAERLASTILDVGYKAVPELMFEKYCKVQGTKEGKVLKAALQNIDDDQIQSRLSLMEIHTGRTLRKVLSKESPD